MIKLFRKPTAKRTQPSRLVYTHIAKALGSTTNVLLSDIMHEYGLDTLAFSGASSVYADPTLPTTLLEKHELRLQDYSIITGHIPFSTARASFDPAVYITCLRNPIDHLFSSYCSQPENSSRADYGLDRFQQHMIENATAEWAIDNYQTRMLCDYPRFGQNVTTGMLRSAQRNLVDHYSIVGLQHLDEDFFSAICLLYDYDFDPSQLERHNVTGPYQRLLTDDHCAFAKKWNHLDIKLFRWAQKHHNHQKVPPRIRNISKKKVFRKLMIGVDGCEVSATNT